MGKDTKIGWCSYPDPVTGKVISGHSFNAWWGCEKVGTECEHCYAETWAKRCGYDYIWGHNTPRRIFPAGSMRKAYNWDKAARDAGEIHLVFVESMGDLFEDRADLNVLRSRLWPIVEECWHLIWLFLTKRPQNIGKMIPVKWHTQVPLNIWWGVTVGHPLMVTRYETLQREIPPFYMPGVLFISMEPMLAPFSEQDMNWLYEGRKSRVEGKFWWNRMPDWLIVGGESGPRKMELSWATGAMDMAQSWGCKVFYKQHGTQLAKELGVKGKGDNLEEWPEYLRSYREFPDALEKYRQCIYGEGE